MEKNAVTGFDLGATTIQMPGDIPTGASERDDTQKLGEVARRAYTLAYRILRHPADAEDVAQEVLVRLLKHSRRLDSGGNIQGWIYRVTVNCCNDVLRQRQRQAELDVDELQAAPQSDEVHDLPKLLKRLSPRERTAVALVFGQGLTCREAARAMTCLPGTVRVLCHRARQKMKPVLEA